MPKDSSIRVSNATKERLKALKLDGSVDNSINAMLDTLEVASVSEDTLSLLHKNFGDVDVNMAVKNVLDVEAREAKRDARLKQEKSIEDLNSLEKTLYEKLISESIDHDTAIAATKETVNLCVDAATGDKNKLGAILITLSSKHLINKLKGKQ